MPNDFPRSRRVAEQIQRELGTLITTEVKDPRVNLATVTDVEVSRDLAYAKVYIGVLEMQSDPKEVMAGLNNAAGFLRARLGRLLKLRIIPNLKFIEDTTEREAQRLSDIIDSAVAQDRDHHQE
mgnify:CR=1 FL=1